MSEKKNDYELELIDLDQDLAGYRRFISCWLYRDQNLSLVVDPGPRASAQTLIRSLHKMGVERLDLVLLTHIHLDHGGSAAEILDAFPEARLVCHEKGVAHLLDPKKLWAGSLATLGEVAQAYGQPTPVDPERLLTVEQLAGQGVDTLYTPGHAPHHLSFLCSGVLFAGEAIATCMELEQGVRYIRPATPPRFIPEVFLKSLDLVESLDPAPNLVAFAHHGSSTDLAGWCRMAREQLQLWLRLVARECEREKQEIDDLFAVVHREDPVFGRAFDLLPQDMQQRERYYVGNSLRGLVQHLN